MIEWVLSNPWKCHSCAQEQASHASYIKNEKWISVSLAKQNSILHLRSSECFQNVSDIQSFKKLCSIIIFRKKLWYPYFSDPFTCITTIKRPSQIVWIMHLFSVMRPHVVYISILNLRKDFFCKVFYFYCIFSLFSKILKFVF